MSSIAMAPKELSKRLSYYLRHAPGEIGLTLEPGGWVPVDALIAALGINRCDLDRVVASSDKQRFAIDPSGTRIRANQGHSVDVDLQLVPVAPPERLYHGTGEPFAEAIRREGLRRQSRHHVHLSADRDTARMVGTRHGKPVVFVVDAAAMHAAGIPFYQAQNGVWLVDGVPPGYLR